MNINTLLETFKDALSQDSALSTWANVVYGQSHAVFVNVDVRNPPSAADCPYVVVFPSGKSAGPAAGRKRHNFSVVCCVHDDTSVVNPENNVTEYFGVQRLEAFRKLAEDALAAAVIGNAVIDMVDIEYDTIETFPFMLAAMEVQVGEAKLIGADPLE